MDGTCTICLDDVGQGQGTTLECGHTFHVGCILHWFRHENPCCPNCRSDRALQPWYEPTAAQRISAMRRKKAALPPVLQRMLRELDALKVKSSTLQKELRGIRSAYKHVFRAERGLSQRLHTCHTKSSVIRRALSVARTDSVPFAFTFSDSSDEE